MSVHSGAQQPQSEEQKREVPGAQQPQAHGNGEIVTQGIIRCFKAHYCAKSIEHAVDCYECGTSPSQIYDIDQLDAMRLANKAWNEVDTTTIRNCWHKAGILLDFEMDTFPSQPSLSISSLAHLSDSVPQADAGVLQVEVLVQSTLDKLEATGALQHSNRMDLAELLNPAIEAHDMFDAMEKDIFDAVMEAKKV